MNYKIINYSNVLMNLGEFWTFLWSIDEYQFDILCLLKNISTPFSRKLKHAVVLFLRFCVWHQRYQSFVYCKIRITSVLHMYYSSVPYKKFQCSFLKAFIVSWSILPLQEVNLPASGQDGVIGTQFLISILIILCAHGEMARHWNSLTECSVYVHMGKWFNGHWEFYCTSIYRHDKLKIHLW